MTNSGDIICNNRHVYVFDPLDQPNVDLVLRTRGSGALQRTIPDGSAEGGNCRGDYAVDWQSFRSTADRVASGAYSVISGGFNNIANGDISVISGGNSNISQGNNSTIGGGNGNQAMESTTTVGGGANNKAIGPVSTISGGTSNIANGQRSVISGGMMNTTNGNNSTINGGTHNITNNHYTVIPGGHQSMTRAYGQLAHSSGGFDNIVGSAQYSLYLLRNTTNRTTAELFLDGFSQRLEIPTNMSILFSGHIVGRHENGDSVGYEIKGMIKNVNDSVSIVGSPEISVIASNFNSSNVSVQILSNQLTRSLQILVTSKPTGIVKWIATLHTTELFT